MLQDVVKFFLLSAVFVIGVFIITALSAPLVYYVSNIIWHISFRACVNRVLMVTALLGVLCLMKVNRLRWQDVGVSWSKNSCRDLVAGLILGVISVTILIGLSRTSVVAYDLNKLPKALISALFVAPLEEIEFRGIVLVILIRKLGGRIGLIFGALIFSAVHFLKVPPQFNPDPVTLLSGITSLKTIFQALWHGAWSWQLLLILFLLGLVLGAMLIQSGELWLPMGFHAAIVILALIRVIPREIVSQWRLTTPILIILFIIVWSGYKYFKNLIKG